MQIINNFNEIILPDWSKNCSYNRGSLVRKDSNIYVCDVAHDPMSDFDPEYWTKINGSDSQNGGDSVATLTELTKTLQIGANQTIIEDIKIPSNKCEIRTVYLNNDKLSNMQLKIYESAAKVFCVYESNTEDKIYDILNVPYIDKDDTKSIHVEITNRSGINIAATLIIKTTNIN